MWVMPVFIASMFLVVLSVWNVMTGRWSTADWKEVGLSYLVMIAFLYVLFLLLVVLRRLSIPAPPAPVIGVVGATAFVVIVTRLRKRRARS